MALEEPQMSSINGPVQSVPVGASPCATPDSAAGTTAPSPLELSYQSFLRDLPALLKQHPDQWVAYAGERQLAIGPSRRMLYQECLAAGHRNGEFLVCSIEPPQDVLLDDLLDV
jgi:hypothetical protein